MKAIGRERLGWAVAGMLVLALSIAIISPALGGPSVLTLGKAKKVFITKKKATKTYLTKAAAGEAYLTKAGASQTYLTPAGGDFRYLRPAGEIRVPIHPSDWLLTSNTSNVLQVPGDSDFQLVKQATPANDVDVYGPASGPTELYGTALEITGLEVCYSFTQSAQDEAVLDRTTVLEAGGSASTPVTASPTTILSDPTGRIDDACTKLTFPAVPLDPNDSVGIGLRFDFPDANTSVRIGRASLILSP
jgi:hypothetical protein